jgi:hypothetical protein
MSWSIAGAYFESCNCDAICPCRMIGGVPGGRSTHGVCFGALSWRIDEGHLDGIDLSGLCVSLTTSYDDDEPGSPWTIVMHVDERGDAAQRQAIEQILLGELGGDVMRLPWVRKPRNLVDVRVGEITIEDGPEGHTLTVRDTVTLRATRAVDTNETVACGIPGYDRAGTELYTDSFVVHDDPFSWELKGNCAFAGSFAYSS